MKFIHFGFLIGVVLMTVFVPLLRADGRADQNICQASEKCLAPEKCEVATLGSVCKNANEVCCSIVKPEFSTHCSHFGGECMERCNSDLQRNVVDCPAGTRCCVLV